ncbi:MAG: PDZ domain-containing protein [Proteobacteria bacterium]|jgi:hypothetical protein|nr:PDZ domain-containing protein [Pseudomonadota bacterium]
MKKSHMVLVALGLALLLSLLLLWGVPRNNGDSGRVAALGSSTTSDDAEGTTDGPEGEQGQEEPLAPLPSDLRGPPPPEVVAADLEVLADELLADEGIHAVCELSLPMDRADGYLAVGDPTEMNGRRVPVVLGKAYLAHLEEGEGSGVLTIEGYAPTEIRWNAGHDEPGGCEPNPVVLSEGGTAITGQVTHEGTGAPAMYAWVEGCGGLGNTGSDGLYYMEVLPGPCRVIAMRQDGVLRTVSEAVEVNPQKDQDLVIDLVIPGFPRAGLGIVIEAVDNGFLVKEVIEGGGAEEGGIEAGDVVIEVDGEPATDMELAEFVDVVGGREGSEVRLLVSTGGVERELVVERRQIPR